MPCRGSDIIIYAYLAAQKLKADYAIAASVGQGLTVGSAPISGSYAKNGDYSFGADVVIVHVGNEDVAVTGDGAVTAEALASAYQAFLKNVRAVHGSNAKIVCVSTSSNEVLKTALETACTELGGETAGYYAKLLTASAGKLPTAAEHTAYADTLATYIDSIKNNTVISPELQGAASGYGVEVDFGSSDWEA